MSASATILSWITAEVDQALTRVREQIARFTADPGDTAVLNPCPEHLHQVSGALRMVGLAGATRFCEEIEGGLAGMGGMRPSSQALGVIDKAVLALKEFVDGLERGQSNVPLRLFPMYRELKTLQGQPDAAEKDLFFPDLTLAGPAHPDARAVPAEELPALLQAQRAVFQRGLLAALRNQPAGLDEMRKALNALHQVAAQLPEPRTLWWAAEGLLDGFAAPPDADWLLRAKALCNKLDFQVRDLAAGAQTVNEALLRDVLYAIAKCKPATPRLREIRQLYQLDSQFPDADASGAMEYDLGWLEPALADLRARLEALKGMWLQYVSGEPKSAARFRELVAAFKAKAAELGSAPLARLLDAIALVSARLPDPYPQDSRALVIEMASAFLLAESMVESFTEPAADAEAQIGIMGGWLLDAAQGKSTGEPPAGLRADLSERIGSIRLRAQVAREIVANLQHVEKVLDGFVRDPATRDALPGLATHMRQMHGALTVLGFEDAARVVAICEDLIARCAQPGYDGTSEDMDWIAEGLSSLGFFLDPCLNGREPAGQAIELFFRRYDKAHTPPEQREFDSTVVLTATALKAADEAEAAVAAAIAAAAAAPKMKVAPARPEVNRELLDIYLEEAADVLAGVEVALPACRRQPQDRDALITIRRGFHTLKGSGRMVGLMDLGEVAWEIEQVLNLWLEQKWPASADLLELIAMGSRAFAGWVAQLREGSLTQEIEATALVDFAERLKRVETPAPVSLPVAAPAAQAAQAEAPVATVGAAEAVPSAHADATPEVEEQAVEPVLDFIVRGQTGPMPAIAQELAPAPQVVPEPAPEAQPVPHAERTAPPPPPDVQVGDVRVPPHLFDIYLKEAHQHLAALEAHAQTWRGAPGTEVSPELVRAAHTLASSSRTAGFAPIAALAAALEQWTRHARLTTAPADVGAVAAAIEGLREGVEAVSRREAPASTEALESALRALIARLLAPPAPRAPRRAAPAAEGKGGREQRILRDDIDAQLLPVFLEEAQQLLPQIGADLRDWKAKPEDAQVNRSLQRALHTLKGSARMAGAIRLGELTHLMESRIEAALEAGKLDAALFGELEQKLDRLSLDLERMQYAPEVTTAVPAEAPRVEAPLPSPAAMLRVNADVLDQLINESGEVSIARTRVEAELRAVKQSIADLSDSVARLRAQLREIEVQADSQMQSRATELEQRNREFDPLEFDRYTRLQELTRLMAESLHDATSIQQTLARSLGDADGALAHQSRVSRDVQQALMRMRAVPFANLNERLYRIVRQTARELGKNAELDIQGSQVELDRSVLERIGAPLEHMLRNALAHGLEAPEARTAAGKPETGRVTVGLRQEANEIALTVSDDGAGLDLDKLRRRAQQRGLLTPEAATSDTEAAQLIFISGLSTADEVTELAGRGVGMDVVKSEIGAIGGRVEIATARGQGTTFTVYLPLTLAVTQAVLVRAGAAPCAVPSALVEQVQRLKSDAMAARFAGGTIEFQGRGYPLYDLARLQGGAGEAIAPGYHSVLLLRSGAQRFALHVDELLGNQEIVVKAIGPQLARVPGVSGATVLADGRIALIVNPVQLVQRARGAPLREAAQPLAVAGAAPLIMVVDDSLTVRKITGRLLEREGYRVLAAKDGLDALELLKDALPAVMLVDIEMPRMDGFDLTRTLREDPRTREIPIIMISSRTAGKHRDQAMQLGVNAFLGKPFPELELLQHITGYIEMQKERAA